MPHLTACQRASQIASDFIDTEFKEEQEAKHWLVERITAAIEDVEISYQIGLTPLRAFYPGH